MLQGFNKHLRFRTFLFLTLVLAGTACRRDSSAFSEEKSAYLADYESSGNRWGFIDTMGQLVIEAEYDDAAGFSEDKAAVNKAGFWGFINREGKEIIKPQFRSAFTFHENRARVKPFDLPDCYVTSSGKLLSSDQWSAAGDFADGRAVVKVGTHYGYIDTSGQLVIRPEFSRARNFENGIAVVEFQGKQGVIDKEGKYRIPPDYNQIHISLDGNFILSNAESKSLIWSQSGALSDSISSSVAKESDGKLVSISKNGKMQFYNLETKKVIGENLFSQLVYLGEHRWCAKRDSLYQLLDENGMMIGNMGYDQINKFSDRFAAYKRGEFWGYLDVNGKEITEPIFGLAWDYKNGYARVAFKDGIGYIDSNQQLAFYPPPGTVEMRDFDEGLAPVEIRKN